MFQMNLPLPQTLSFLLLDFPWCLSTSPPALVLGNLQHVQHTGAQQKPWITPPHPLSFPDKQRAWGVHWSGGTLCHTVVCFFFYPPGFFFFLHKERRSIRRPNNALTVLSETAWLHLVLFGPGWMAVSFMFWVFGRYFIFVKLHF